MNAQEEYKKWLSNELLPDNLRKELLALDEDEIHDRFYKDLVFGTGGLRGIMGAGTNRMNVCVVARASQGVSSYLLENFHAPSVCIAYDTRNNSRAFAYTAAKVFCANGIDTYIFDAPHPTPMLSFAVRHIHASAGIVITASHNPKEYNGYKVYGDDGGQITDIVAGEILRQILQCDIFASVRSIDIEDAVKQGLLHIMSEEIDKVYYSKVRSLCLRKDMLDSHASELKILYSPLHGTGYIPVKRILREIGFTNVSIVHGQETQNGNFPTAPFPNPEIEDVYDLAIRQAADEIPDLIFATDPDCDRIGVLVKSCDGKYIVLTGNQTGALLCDYIIKTHRELKTMPHNPAVIKTIVTTEMARHICAQYNVPLFDVLTGFKYIGELAEKWSHDGSHEFIFGFEESCGYLAGNFVRDKDAVIAASLIAEMALYYKIHGKTLYEALKDLQTCSGYFTEILDSKTFKGESGIAEEHNILQHFRNNYAEIFSGSDMRLIKIEDYQTSKSIDLKTGEDSNIMLPCSNVLKFFLDDGSTVVLRPSGTEPKIKVYVSSPATNSKASQERAEKLHNHIMGFIS